MPERKRRNAGLVRAYCVACWCQVMVPASQPAQMMVLCEMCRNQTQLPVGQ